MVFIIPKEPIEKVLGMETTLETVEAAFAAYGKKQVQMPPKSYIYFEKGDLRSMPAYVKTDTMNIAGIKSVNVHPGNGSHNLPTVMATILLTDPETGLVIAILDGTYITAMRTGAAGGVASKYLSKRDSKTAAFIGTGIQARTQLEAIALVRHIKAIKVFDLRSESADAFCSWAAGKFGFDVCACSSIKEACRGADIITTTTPSRKPVVLASMVEAGAHINAIGADAQGKEEIDPKLLKSAKVVVDDWAQASHSGEINVPVSKGLIKEGDIYATLGEIVAGKKSGRKNEKEITVFDSTGLAIQDISTAYVVYKKLLESGEKLLEVKMF